MGVVVKLRCYASESREYHSLCRGKVMRTLLFVPLLAVGFVGSPSIAAPQDSYDKEFVVSQVGLPMTTQLSPREQATIRAGLIGRCFDDQQLGELAGRVRDTLQSFGYFRATVSPTIAVVDVSRHPRSNGDLRPRDG